VTLVTTPDCQVQMLDSTMGSDVTLSKAPSDDVQHWLDRSLDKLWTICSA